VDELFAAHYAWKVLLGAFTNILYTEAAVLLGMFYKLPAVHDPTDLYDAHQARPRYIEPRAISAQTRSRRLPESCFLCPCRAWSPGYDGVHPVHDDVRHLQLLGGGKTMLYGDLIYMKFITEQSWNAGRRALRHPTRVRADLDDVYEESRTDHVRRGRRPAMVNRIKRFFAGPTSA
jgi:hypothetical protein